MGRSGGGGEGLLGLKRGAAKRPANLRVNQGCAGASALRHSGPLLSVCDGVSRVDEREKLVVRFSGDGYFTRLVSSLSGVEAKVDSSGVAQKFAVARSREKGGMEEKGGGERMR